MTENTYTFGDNNRAGKRLQRLAEIYQPETRDLLQRGCRHQPRLAVDLGCGPGWSTRLLQVALHPQQTVGLDASERYVAEARRQQSSDLQFMVHDVVRVPFPVSSPDLLFCRFLLTLLNSIKQVLASWASISAPDATLLIHETETLDAEHPALRRYYELIGQLQERYGQVLLVGAVLDECLRSSGWRVVESNRRTLEKKSKDMADLHLANLRTWRNDEYARLAFDPREIDSLERFLERIANSSENAAVVSNVARQTIARL